MGSIKFCFLLEFNFLIVKGSLEIRNQDLENLMKHSFEVN